MINVMITPIDLKFKDISVDGKLVYNTNVMDFKTYNDITTWRDYVLVAMNQVINTKKPYTPAQIEMLGHDFSSKFTRRLNELYLISLVNHVVHVNGVNYTILEAIALDPDVFKVDAIAYIVKTPDGQKMAVSTLGKFKFIERVEFYEMVELQEQRLAKLKVAKNRLERMFDSNIRY